MRAQGRGGRWSREARSGARTALGRGLQIRHPMLRRPASGLLVGDRNALTVALIPYKDHRGMLGRLGAQLMQPAVERVEGHPPCQVEHEKDTVRLRTVRGCTG